MAIPNVTRGGLRSARFLAAGTATRILLTPVVMGLILVADGDDDTETLAGVLFCIAAATDYIDGRLARRWNVTSKLGSFLDTTADKLLVSGVLIALLAVDRVSPWIVALIVGRELVLMALRGVIASEGEVMAPSMLGKLKTSVQFLAIALAILRPGDPVGGVYVDEWAMLAAAAITVWSGADYLRARAARAHPRRRRDVTRVFLTGGSGLIGGALAARLAERGDEVVALARSDAGERALAARGARVVRGDVLDEDALAAGMAGCELLYHVAGINTMCPDDPAALFHVNVRGAETAVRAAARADVGRVVLTSSAASLGEAHGTVGREDTPHRGTYLSVYERSKHEGEVAAFAAARRAGVELVSVNPSSVQGPGRAGGTGRIMIAYLNGRLRAFVDTQISIVDIADCVEAHVLGAERGADGERYVISGSTISSREALEIVSELSGVRHDVKLLPPVVARAAGALVEGAFRARGKTPPVCREMVRTLLHGHRYDGSRATRELGLEYTPVAETFRRTIDWANAEGLIGRRD